METAYCYSDNVWLTIASGRRHSCSSIWSQCSCAQCHMRISEFPAQSHPSKSASRYHGRPTMCKASHLQTHKRQGKYTIYIYYVFILIHPSIHPSIVPSLRSSFNISSIHSSIVLPFHYIHPSINRSIVQLFCLSVRSIRPIRSIHPSIQTTD